MKEHYAFALQLVDGINGTADLGVIAEVQPTGGGCEAIQVRLPNDKQVDAYLLLTDGDAGVPTDRDSLTVVIYSDNDDSGVLADYPADMPVVEVIRSAMYRALTAAPFDMSRVRRGAPADLRSHQCVVLGYAVGTDRDDAEEAVESGDWSATEAYAMPLGYEISEYSCRACGLTSFINQFAKVCTYCSHGIDGK